MSLKSSHCLRSFKQFSDQSKIKKWQKRFASKINRNYAKVEIRKSDLK